MKNNFIQNLNIIDGVITYNDFDIDENTPFQDQKYSFKEDILQIKFGKHFLLDVGWYPEFNPKGYFKAYVIQNYDWDNPLYEEKCRTVQELKAVIEKFAALINKLEA